MKIIKFLTRHYCQHYTTFKNFILKLKKLLLLLLKLNSVRKRNDNDIDNFLN